MQTVVLKHIIIHTDSIEAGRHISIRLKDSSEYRILYSFDYRK